MKMKKSDFKTLVKEIVKEVMLESSEDYDGDEETDDPVDLSMFAGKGTGKLDKKWRGKSRILQQIHNEPEFKEKEKELKAKSGDAPFKHSTFSNKPDEEESN